MVSLLDIAPAAETVLIRGKELPITGISAEGLVVLLQTYPELQALFTGGGNIDSSSAWALGGKVVAALIAAGTGLPGNREAEALAASLTISDQAKLLEPILRHTLPDGLGPFVERLSALAAVLGIKAEA